MISARVAGVGFRIGIELIADMVMRPHFAPDELEREKEVVLQELGEARDTPSDIIFDDLWSAAYPDQPLGRSVLGDEASVAAIAVDDLHAWRSERYRAGSLFLVAAGKVDHDALVRLAETRFAGLPEGVIDPCEPARFGGGIRAGGARADQAHLAAAKAGPAWPVPMMTASTPGSCRAMREPRSSRVCWSDRPHRADCGSS